MVDGNNWSKIDDNMQRGYSYLMKSNYVSACSIWKEVWNDIISAMDANNCATINEFDDIFGGMQLVTNWATDYEMELRNACIDDKSFAIDRIEFCREYLKRIEDQSELNSLNMRCAIAESYFFIGKLDEGEEEFIKLTDEYKEWCWGHIRWADVYSDSFMKENINYSKAIDILTQALNINGIDKKAVIKDRLITIYEACGMKDKAALITIDENDFGAPLSDLGKIAENARHITNELLKIPEQVSEHKKKIGRNDPCPCGSKNKYKRCCGA